MVAVEHALHSVVRAGEGYVARCMCGSEGSPRITPRDALDGQQDHVRVVPGVIPAATS
jgi:hypothetical protein